MAASSSRYPRRRALFVGVVTFGLIAGVSWTLWTGASRNRAKVRSAQAAAAAEQLAARVETFTRVRLELARSLGRLWQDERADRQQQFVERAEDLVTAAGGLLAVNWVDTDRVIRWVVPERDNRAAKGRDLSKHPLAGPAIAAAAETGVVQVTPAIQLYQGGLGVVAYVPLRAGGRCVGFVNVVFRLQALLQSATDEATRERFAIDLLEGDRSLLALAPGFVMDPELSARRKLRIGNRSFELVLQLRKGGVVDAPVENSALLFGLITAILAGALSWRLTQRRGELERLIRKREHDHELLEASEAKLHIALEATEMGVWQYDSVDGTVDWTERAARIHGMDAGGGQLRIEDYIDLMHPDDRAVVQERIERTVASLTPLVTRHRVRRQDDGVVRWVDGHGQALADAAGKTVAVVGTVRDVTERIEFENQVRQTQKLESLGVMAGGMAHDFNNLMTGVIGHAELMLRKRDDPRQFEESTDRIIRSARRAADLCLQMLAYSGRGHSEVSTVRLASLVEDILDLLDVSISKQVHLQLVVEDESAKSDVDVSQMRQVAMNLITNAADAVAGKGHVTVRIGSRDCDQAFLDSCMVAASPEPGRYAFLAVGDDGVGMTPEVLRTIFDPFVSTKEPGRGLGLAAVFGIVHRHCGAIAVESSPGEGSEFTVFLPYSSGECPVVATAAPERESTDGAVLVIDDEADVRAVMRLVLESAGATVIEADCGEAGVDAFEKNSQSLTATFLDMTMPDLGGDEVLARIRSQDSSSPIVLMSGYTPHAVSDLLQQFPATTFLQKPFSRSDLLAALSGAQHGETVSGG